MRRATSGDAAVTSYAYDSAGRLQMLSHDPAGTNRDHVLGFTYNPASQIRTRSASNDAYALGGAANVVRPYAVNGLNQYTSAGPATFAYDPNGNLASTANAPWSTNYVYDVENRLVSAAGTHNATLTYDPLGRLWQVSSGSSIRRLVYDGDALIAEYDAAGNMPHRYIHGNDPGADDPLVWYHNAAYGWRQVLFHDHQGSIVGVTDMYANSIAANSYDPWGIPGANNAGRFGSTGQTWVPELGLWYYKARFYSPTTGRFLQVDPVGYDDDINLYAYVRNDPVNHTDPDGKTCIKNSDGKSVTCKVDNPGKLSAKALDKANTAYTRAVNRLLYNPTKRIVLQGRDAKDFTISRTTTAGKIAEALIEATVNYGGENGGFNAVSNGEVGTTKGQTITLFAGGIRQAGNGLDKTIIHEGAHGTRAGQSLQATARPEFNADHQLSFKRGAGILFDNYDK